MTKQTKDTASHPKDANAAQSDNPIAYRSGWDAYFSGIDKDQKPALLLKGEDEAWLKGWKDAKTGDEGMKLKG